MEGLAVEKDRLPTTRLVSRRDVADLFQVTTETVGTWVERGLLPSPVRIGRKVFWTREVIVALLEGGRQRPGCGPN
jgi:predicted DNA-binding transcriptional regulator AlpA